MAKQKSILHKFGKFLSSIKLAVIVLIGIGFMSAYGTIVESMYDARTAQTLVYHSWWSYTILGLLCVNLIAVMVDRWPWKPRHSGFLMAHIGIIVLLLGSLLTRYYGIDGSIRFAIGEKEKNIWLTDEVFEVWSSLDGLSFRRLSPAEPVQFLTDRPGPDNIKDYSAGGQTIKVLDYHPYALRDVKIEASENAADGPAVRFQIQNERVNVSNWLMASGGRRTAVEELGPAQVILTTRDIPPGPGNYILLRPDKKDKTKMTYHIQTMRNPNQPKTGVIEPGDTVETGWMNLKFRLLKYHPQAKNKVSYVPIKRPGPLSTSAVKVQFNDEERWLGLNSPVRFFTNNTVYLLRYGNVYAPLGFEMKLKEFKVPRYQGTMRAASYESIVEVPVSEEEKRALEKQNISKSSLLESDDLNEEEKKTLETMPNSHMAMINAQKKKKEGFRDVLISMNNPLKMRGFTFYQASFEQDNMGNPTASILSVNRDPGRFLKYLGSLLICLGAIHLFYMKGRKRKPMTTTKDVS